MIPETWETNNISPVTIQTYKPKQFVAWSKEHETRQIPVYSLSGGDRAECKEKIRLLLFTGKTTEKRKQSWGKYSRNLESSPLSIHLNIDQYMGAGKLKWVREETLNQVLGKCIWYSFRTRNSVCSHQFYWKVLWHMRHASIVGDNSLLTDHCSNPN